MDLSFMAAQVTGRLPRAPRAAKFGQVRGYGLALGTGAGCAGGFGLGFGTSRGSTSLSFVQSWGIPTWCARPGWRARFPVAGRALRSELKRFTGSQAGGAWAMGGAPSLSSLPPTPPAVPLGYPEPFKAGQPRCMHLGGWATSVFRRHLVIRHLLPTSLTPLSARPEPELGAAL